MPIPLVDLTVQYQSIRHEVDAAVLDVLSSGAFILGRLVKRMEEAVAAYLSVKHAVGVASGTDALWLALRACGIGPGAEVIVPAYTFFATAEAVTQAGATPVFADIEPVSYGIDARSLEASITPRTRAIIPVHLYGCPADLRPVLRLARDHNLKVIEDNAQAFGAEFGGCKTGSLGDAGCLSFFPTKNLAGYGDGGMVVTNDPSVAEHVRKLRDHGSRTKHVPEMIGWNSRLDELQAAILLVKMRHVDAWNARRRSIAGAYGELLQGLPVQLPREPSYGKHVYNLYVVRLPNRDRVKAHLDSLGIASAVYYPIPLHQTIPYQDNAPTTLPEAERAARETLALPMFPEMTAEQVRSVAVAVRQAIEWE
jgi:dTDP-4-amino-4,6-dideoxygalactose transaminase